MKNKKLIIGGVAILILYFLYKKKSKQTDVAQKGNVKTYYKTKDGRVLQCADGTFGGTKENPTTTCAVGFVQ